MRIRLIRRQTIEDFMIGHARSSVYFEEWLEKIKRADWDAPGDIISTFPSADLLRDGLNRVVFNIGGNHYRLIAKYWFGTEKIHLYIKWIGTHGAYTALCSKNGQYSVDNY